MALLLLSSLLCPPTAQQWAFAEVMGCPLCSSHWSLPPGLCLSLCLSAASPRVSVSPRAPSPLRVLQNPQPVPTPSLLASLSMCGDLRLFPAMPVLESQTPDASLDVLQSSGSILRRHRNAVPQICLSSPVLSTHPPTAPRQHPSHLSPSP